MSKLKQIKLCNAVWGPSVRTLEDPDRAAVKELVLAELFIVVET